MAFVLETFVTDNRIAQITTDGRILFGMESGPTAKRLTSLFLTIDYTKGTETDVSLVFDVGLIQYTTTRNFRIVSNTNPLEPYVAKMTTTGLYLVPVPIPSRTTQLIISSLAVFDGTVKIGFTSDEGITSPRATSPTA